MGVFEECGVLAGEYGAMPQVAGDWSEAGGLLCEVLAAELAHLKHSPAQSTPPASVSSQGPVQGSAQDQNPSSTQCSSEGAGPLVDAPVRQRADDGTAGQKRGASEGNESLGEAAWMSGEEDSRPIKRSRVTGAPSEPATVYWPDVLQPASGRMGSRRTSPRKSVPEPPAEFAAGVCAAWAALSATCKPPMESADRSHGSMAGGDPEQDEASDAPQRSSREGGGFEAASHWEDDISDLRTLAGPAGFLSCSQPPPSNAELREALQIELNGSGKLPCHDILTISIHLESFITPSSYKACPHEGAKIRIEAVGHADMRLERTGADRVVCSANTQGRLRRMCGGWNTSASVPFSVWRMPHHC